MTGPAGRRILHVINMGTTCGGAERLVAELAAAQRAAGDGVRVLSSDLPGAGRRFSDATWSQPAGPRGPLRRLSGQLRNPRARAALAAELAGWRPHVVHLHTVGLLAPATLALLDGTPTVMTVHGPEVFLRDTELWTMPAEYFRPQAPGRLTIRGRLVRTLSRLVVARRWRHGLKVVDGYVAPSRYVAGLVARDLGPVRLVPNAIRPRDPGGDAPRAEPTRRLLFAGRLEPIKGPQVLLEALPMIRRARPGVTLVVCGSGPMAGPLRELVDQLGLDDAVTLLGWLDAEQVSRQMADADVVVVPSLGPEAFGLSCLEALAVGTPVVASAVGGLPDLVRPEVTGLLTPPGEPTALATAVIRLLGDDGLRDRLGAQGRAMSAGFTLEAHRRAVDDAYLAAIAEGDEPGPAGTQPDQPQLDQPQPDHRRPDLPGRRTPGRLVGRLRLAGADPLLRNSALLLLATVELAAGGFVFWQLVAHLFTPEQVGLAGALISASTLVATLAMLGMNNALIRYLAVWPDRGRTVSTGVALVAAAAAVGALAFAAGAPWFAPALTGPLHGAGLLAFTALTVGGALGTLYDTLFVALRSAGHILARNTVATVLRLALPVALVSLGGFGIFTAYWLAFALGLVLYVVALQRRFGLPLRSPVSLARLRAMCGYSLGTYLATVILMAPSLLTPILVAHWIGLREAANYYLAALLASVLLFVPEATSRSFFAEATHQGGLSRAGLGRVLWLTGAAQAPIAGLLVLLGRPILHLFGAAYAPAYPLLVVLAGTNLLAAVSFVGSTVLLVSGRIRLLCAVTAAAYGVSLVGVVAWGDRGTIWIAGALLAGEAILAAAYLGVIGRVLWRPAEQAGVRR